MDKSIIHYGTHKGALIHRKEIHFCSRQKFWKSFINCTALINSTVFAHTNARQLLSNEIYNMHLIIFFFVIL